MLARLASTSVLPAAGAHLARARFRCALQRGSACDACILQKLSLSWRNGFHQSLAAAPSYRFDRDGDNWGLRATLSRIGNTEIPSIPRTFKKILESAAGAATRVWPRLVDLSRGALDPSRHLQSSRDISVQLGGMEQHAHSSQNCQACDLWIIYKQCALWYRPNASHANPYSNRSQSFKSVQNVPRTSHHARLHPPSDDFQASRNDSSIVYGCHGLGRQVWGGGRGT